MMKNLIILFIMLIFASCGSRKNTTTDTTFISDEKELQIKQDSSNVNTSEKDSVYVEKTLAVKNEVTIDNPCDTISRKLRVFNISTNNSIIKSDGKSIKVTTECEESISKFESEIKDKNAYIKEIEITNKKLQQKLTKYENESKVKIRWWSLPTFIITVVLLLFIWYVLKFQFKLKWL